MQSKQDYDTANNKQKGDNMTTQEQVKIVTTLGKVIGALTSILSYTPLLPSKYVWVGVVIVCAASVCKDVLACLNSIWNNPVTLGNKYGLYSSDAPPTQQKP
jgi:hypothetical protein